MSRPEAQHERPALTLTTGVAGYRLAFIGGSTFDVIADNLTYEQAAAMFYAGRAAPHALATTLMHRRVA